MSSAMYALRKTAACVGLSLFCCSAALALTPGMPVSSAAPAPASKGAPPAQPEAAMEKQRIRAQLMPRRFTTVAAEISAKINRVAIQEGGRFSAGQLLVSFDCSMQDAMLKKAQAELAAAEVTLRTNQRLEELNSIGRMELDLSQVSVRKFSAETSAQKTLLSKCRIHAPFAGRVAEQRARDQQYVQAGQPLLDIIDDSVLELEFLAPSRWLSWLKAGRRFEVEIDETRKTYPAKFIRIGARVDPVSQSLKVAAEIDGRFPELVAGMSGRVLISSP